MHVQNCPEWWKSHCVYIRRKSLWRRWKAVISLAMAERNRERYFIGSEVNFRLNIWKSFSSVLNNWAVRQVSKVARSFVQAPVCQNSRFTLLHLCTFLLHLQVQLVTFQEEVNDGRQQRTKTKVCPRGVVDWLRRHGILPNHSNPTSYPSGDLEPLDISSIRCPWKLWEVRLDKYL